MSSTKALDLPKYDEIKLPKILPASTLIFYNGNKLTEWFGRQFAKHPYKLPAFHAAFYLSDGLFLNVGKFKTLQKLEDERLSTRRIDVITYKNIPDEVRRRLVIHAALDTTKPKIGFQLPDYAVLDYARFLLKFLKPSRKDICSENVVELFQSEGIQVSEKEPFNTAPWHLFEFAVKNPQLCEVRTYWKGPDFKY